MRVIYPETIIKERKALIPYLEYRDGEGWGLKSNAPNEIADRYRILVAKIAEFDKQCR